MMLTQKAYESLQLRVGCSEGRSLSVQTLGPMGANEVTGDRAWLRCPNDKNNGR